MYRFSLLPATVLRTTQGQIQESEMEGGGYHMEATWRRGDLNSCMS